MNALDRVLRRHLTAELSHAQAVAIGNRLGIDWSEIDKHQFHLGLNVETEHGSTFGDRDPTTLSLEDLPDLATVVLDHLQEVPDYYTKLKEVEDPQEEDLGDRIDSPLGGGEAEERLDELYVHEPYTVDPKDRI